MPKCLAAPSEIFLSDVRVTHPDCPSHVNKSQKPILKQNEAMKKTQYNEHVREIGNEYQPTRF